MSTDFVFLFLYFLFVVFVVYPPSEFHSAGFTIEQLFSFLLGDEDTNFLRYHNRRMNLNTFAYSILPLGFVLGSIISSNEDGILFNLFVANELFKAILLGIAILIPLSVSFDIFYSHAQNYVNHPIAKNLKLFANNDADWRTIAIDINAEYRRSFDKFNVKISPVLRIVVMENWIIKVTPLKLTIAHLSDANFTVKESDLHNLSHLTAGIAQYLTILVESSRVKSFTFRLNMLDFNDLQDRLSQIINIQPGVEIYKTVIEKFIKVFKDTVELNPKYKTEQELELCFGCSRVTANVKLQKLCEYTEDVSCEACFCRPMWCVDCLGRWFGHRQDADNTETWLRSKCPCPMCRKTFCVRDVCLVEEL